jgi:predicted SAM-dependent methyltransferase
VIEIWKKLPFPLRTLVHRIVHRFNSSQVLLRLISVRHQLTVKKLKRASTPAYLRIGESRKFTGWISTNYQVITSHFLDATKPYGSGKCRYIFADNVVEHLDFCAGEKLIECAWEALIPGGILRLTTPDLESIARKYLMRSQKDVTQFAVDLVEHGFEIRSAPDLLRITFTKFGHEKGFIYDFQTLENLLKAKGFIEIKKFLPGESEDPNLRNLESRVKPSDMWSQMAVEARKP